MATSTATKRVPSSYRCAECGWTSVKWVGRCGECLAWGSVDETRPAVAAALKSRPVTHSAVPISQVQASDAISRPSGVPELDRVLGGGVVSGAVLLLAGEPGVGKSTLLLEVAARSARQGLRTLYVSGEESASQVRMRAERTGALEDQLYLAAEVDLGAVLSHIEVVQPQLLVIDSIQTVASSEVDGVAGGVTQVRAVTAALVRVAKERHLATMLVGHVTKDGSIAGPRALEHVVDVVLQFEGEHSSQLRLLRAVKNRFGPVDEIGCFDLGERGIVEVADTSDLFISSHPTAMPGTCLTVTTEGRRPLIAEVQALVDASTGPQPHRAISGLDAARVAMLLAVLQRRVGVRLGGCDVYAATIGGATLRGPATDLAVAIALTSAATNLVVPAGVVAIGEVGLAGELRRVPNLSQRLAEAARLGFTRAIVPAAHDRSAAPLPTFEGLTVLECSELWEAVRALQLVGPSSRRHAPELHVVG